jgi:hypothetical protein
MPTSDSEYSSFLSIHKFSQSFQLKRLAFFTIIQLFEKTGFVLRKLHG